MSNEPIKIDLHGMKFREAKTGILDSLEGHCKAGFTIFEIVHGYRGGKVLRNYVRNKLKSEFEMENPIYCLTLNISGKGSTMILVNINK